MSMGFGFRAKLEESDGKVAAYSYRTYDLSCEEGRQGFGAAELDGVLWVANDGDDLSCEVERYSRFAPEQSPLNQDCVAVVALGGSERALVPTLSVVVPTIVSADVKATSWTPFPHP